MFGHLYYFRLKRLCKARSVVFWTAIFPILLGTMFFFALYNATSSSEESFSPIPTAVYNTGNYPYNEAFTTFVKDVSGKDNHYITIRYVNSRQEGAELVKQGKVDGLITADNKISLTVAENGFNQTILKALLDTYQQTEDYYTDAAKHHPEAIALVQKAVQTASDYTKNVSFQGKNLNNNIGYFYSLLAMCVLYGSIFAQINAMEIQPDFDIKAARRLSAPTNPGLLVITDFLSALTIQIIIYMIVIFYLTKILGVDFGGNTTTLLITGIAGCTAGSGWGYFVGIVIKGSERIKSAVIISSVLFSSFLSGLMIGSMKVLLMERAPIVNFINPATLITDAFYYSGIFHNTAEFTRCILTLFIISAVLCLGSYVTIRRKRYARV